MCEGSFLPSSFGPHQKHTEFESSLRSYPISDVATCADRDSRTSLCLLGRGRGPPSRRHLESSNKIQGRAHPMHGLFIFTRRHYSANIRYEAAAGPLDNAN